LLHHYELLHIDDHQQEYPLVWHLFDPLLFQLLVLGCLWQATYKNNQDINFVQENHHTPMAVVRTSYLALRTFTLIAFLTQVTYYLTTVKAKKKSIDWKIFAQTSLKQVMM